MSKNKGVNLIKKNIGKFQNIITGLETGIQLCDNDLSSNNVKIEKFTNENKTIEESKAIATTFKNNLNDMLIVPSLKTKKE